MYIDIVRRVIFFKMFRYACEESRYATNDLIAHGRQRTE